MVRWISSRRPGPIGVDLGQRSIKLLQLSGDCKRVVAAARWDLAGGKVQDEERDAQWTNGLNRAREGRPFVGRDAVICLGARDLFVQNVRIPKHSKDSVETLVKQEAASRLPFDIKDAELQFIEAGEVRQGEVTKREVIVLACLKNVLERLLKVVDAAGLRPVAVDVEPAAVLRCYARQFRREADRGQRAMFVHIGASTTAVVIAQDDDALFIKYIDVGGRHFDESVARLLQMKTLDAATLRRHNSDRREDQRDPEVARSVAEAMRPVVDRLTNELSLCVRYHSVTFRGQPLSRLVIGGGEASQSLIDDLAQRLDLSAELGHPLRSLDTTNTSLPGRSSQWDIATGLALRTTAT